MWGTWETLKADMISSFEPSTGEEQARKQLRTLTQVGRVTGYVNRFRELQYKLPGMTMAEAYSAFLAGLTPQIRQHVGAHVDGDLEEAIKMALRLDLYRAEGEKSKGSEKPVHPKPRKQGVHNVEGNETSGGSSGGQVNAVDKKGKKSKRWNGGPKRGGRGGGRGGDRQALKCFCCGEGHLLRNCPEWKNMREHMRSSNGGQQGNA